MAVTDRATHTDGRHERFHLQTAISEIHLHSFDHSKYSQTPHVTSDRIYILFALKADHNRDLQRDWNKPMLKNVLIQDNNSTGGGGRLGWQEVFGLRKAIQNRPIIKDHFVGKDRQYQEHEVDIRK